METDATPQENVTLSGSEVTLSGSEVTAGESEVTAQGSETKSSSKKKKKRSKAKKANLESTAEVPLTQTDPPTVPIHLLFPDENYPMGEMQDYEERCVLVFDRGSVMDV